MNKFLISIFLMFVFNNVGAQTISDEDAKSKGLAFAKESGVTFKLIQNKDDMTGKESMYAMQTFKSPEGVTAEVIIKCGKKYPKNLNIIFNINPLNVPTISQYKNNRSFANGRRNTNGKVQPTFYAIYQGDTKEFYAEGGFNIESMGFMESPYDITDGFLIEKYTNPPIIVHTIMLELKTNKGNILAKIPPYDPAVNSVIKSCPK
jgi:hypothetical protein